MLKETARMPLKRPPPNPNSLMVYRGRSNYQLCFGVPHHNYIQYNIPPKPHSNYHPPPLPLPPKKKAPILHTRKLSPSSLPGLGETFRLPDVFHAQPLHEHRRLAMVKPQPCPEP